VDSLHNAMKSMACRIAFRFRNHDRRVSHPPDLPWILRQTEKCGQRPRAWRARFRPVSTSRIWVQGENGSGQGGPESGCRDTWPTCAGIAKRAEKVMVAGFSTPECRWAKNRTNAPIRNTTPWHPDRLQLVGLDRPADRPAAAAPRCRTLRHKARRSPQNPFRPRPCSSRSARLTPPSAALAKAGDRQPSSSRNSFCGMTRTNSDDDHDEDHRAIRMR